jgi:hypothetical protein
MVPGDDLDLLLSPLEFHLKTVKQHIEGWSSKSGIKKFFVELGNIPVQLNSLNVLSTYASRFSEF